MIERINSLIAAGKNFAFETTCAGHHHVKTLQDCKTAGYDLRIPLILDEAVNIGKSGLFEQKLAEFLHEHA
jgi:predicted ABC-type ATPase